MSDGERRAVSAPLPRIRVERLSADRGAAHARDVLDGPRCDLCGVPVAADERAIPTDVGGLIRRHNICKDHSEHPDSWRRDIDHWEEYRYCPTCGSVAKLWAEGQTCFQCEPVEIPTVEDVRM